MASTGKKGKKNKGKTVPLNDFLSNTTLSWSDQVDEADKLGEFLRKPALPAAPRAARALELDESKIPPYVAYLSNLSYELQDTDIINAFEGLNVTNVRLPRDERSGKLKGFGYVEFGDRESFISALVKYEATIRGRRIKIDVAENEGERRRGGLRDMRDRDSNYDSEKTLGDWRSGPRSEFSSGDDRRYSSSGRKDYGNYRDREGYDKRSGESSWRDSERRFTNDRDGRGYGSRRNYDDTENPPEPKTRTKLILQPRKLPLEELTIKEEGPLKKDEDRVEHEKSSSTSIFGKAKPVDTSAREREIEQRLEKEREGSKSEKEFDKLKPKINEDDLDSETKRPGPPESKENIWVRRSQRLDTQNVTSRDSSNGKKNNLDEPQSNKDIEIKSPVADESQYPSSRRADDYESDRDNDSRYGRYSKTESRYNERNREGGDKSYRRDDRWKDDKDRRDRDKRENDRRERGYDYEKRGGNNGGRSRVERDGDLRRFDREEETKRYNEREGDIRRYDRENESRKSSEKDVDNRRVTQDREGGRFRDQDDHGNKGPRGDKRGGVTGGDKGSRSVKNNQEREKGLQSRDRPREQKKPEDGLRMPKFKEAAAPNYIGTNKYSCLEEDGMSE